MKKYIIFIVLAAFATNSVKPVVKRWDWSTIELSDLRLPALCGTAVSEYQVSGAYYCPDSNWAVWEKAGTHKGYPTIKNHDRSHKACDFWQKYPQDIENMKELGCNSFRFSVEWSAIEPKEGQFCTEVVDHYIQLCDALLQAGITPMITLHHFTHPAWFERKGGFANEENISYFVRFCEYIFNHLSDKVQLWCTINEIGAFVFQGYINGVFPPGKSNLRLAAKVTRNMMNAHCQVYRALKALPNGTEAQIGLVHQYLPFEPSSKYNLLERIPALFMEYVFNHAMLHFLKTGTLFPYIPYYRMVIEDAPQCYDFIGLNFYSRVVFKSQIIKQLSRFYLTDLIIPACLKDEIMTDMQYPICAESLYEAIVDIAKLNVPIYITENGIADSKDDRRGVYIAQYLYALSKALKEGYDIRGYYYWSLMDNFEWDEGWSKKFGLYEVDFTTQKRTLRPKAQLYQNALLTAPRVTNR